MSLQNSFPKLKILDIEVDNLGISQAIDHLIDTVGTSDPGARYIVKPHIEQVEAASRDPGIARVLNQAYLALPDGVSLNWAAYFQQKTGHRWWEVITSLAKIIFQPLELHLILPNHSWGTNFSWSLLEAAARAGRSVLLVGSPQTGSITDTKAYLESKIPGIRIVGTFAGRDPKTGYFSPQQQSQLLKQLQQLCPDITLVGLGFPRQELLIAELTKQLRHGFLIGEGGTFDYALFGGKVKKAPLFMQNRGLEWLWRLLIDPRRIRRQLAIPRFIWHVYRANHRNQIA